ncbi:hypothetical protein PG993_014757 [Apiospora rasikravindrae]|uniref:Uncharacterized protein n=1 Tax=Apiospora rasikravindrae TaxID=990691 RepID=A0ABR1RNR9_9PEZI
MKTTTTIITALLCHASITWALPNSPHAPASTATERLQQPERQASSPSPPKILATTTSEKTWQCDPIDASADKLKDWIQVT